MYLTKQLDKQVFKMLRAGAVGLVPADTTYGISGLALNKTAIDKIFRIKNRDVGKRFIVLIANIEQAVDLGLSSRDLEIAGKYWPAPLTLECPISTKTPPFLHRGHSEISVRIPDSPPLLNLVAKVGPLVSTSANLQGEQPARDMLEAKRIFGNQLDFYVDAGNLKGVPSTMISTKNGKIKILRRGAFKF